MTILLVSEVGGVVARALVTLSPTPFTLGSPVKGGLWRGRARIGIGDDAAATCARKAA